MDHTMLGDEKRDFLQLRLTLVCLKFVTNKLTMSHFTFWYSLSFRPKTETKA